MGDSIRLSKDHGVNPTILVCAWCGKETGEIALLGLCSKLKCLSCGADILGSSTGPCPKCGSKGMYEVIERDVKAPMYTQGGLCDECKKKKQESDDEVKKGGIYWKCNNCGSSGVIKKDSPLAKHVRKQMKIKAPNPCGVEFDEKMCPICSKKKG